MHVIGATHAFLVVVTSLDALEQHSSEQLGLVLHCMSLRQRLPTTVDCTAEHLTALLSAKAAHGASVCLSAARHTRHWKSRWLWHHKQLPSS
ncbi:hypothetical protein BC831DRAFT_491619 [Entophlyctis helioformis]|nr:hypothetical protein BC831DRAFT_491619 [Entophlyctis helioformis]